MKSQNATGYSAIVKFYNYIKENTDLKIYIITGRGEKDCDITINNLNKAGYEQFEPVICRTNEQLSWSAAHYKSFIREQIVKNGTEIVGCCGDQVSDCAGSNAGYIMKVPNYFYYVE